MTATSNGPAKTAGGGSHAPQDAQNQLVPHKAPIETNERGLVLRTLDDMYRFGQYVVASKMAPRGYDTPEKVIIGVQWGWELGLSPMQSLKNISVINNSPAVWGDAVPALCRRHPQFLGISERWDGQGETRKCIVVMTRKDDANATTREFGYQDAKRAGLLSRDTYKNYPDRMYQCRARAWAARDCFADALMGLAIAEEVQDQQYLETTKPDIKSGDDAPLNSLEDAAELLGADDAQFEPSGPGVACLVRKDSDLAKDMGLSPSGPTSEELADPEYMPQEQLF